MIRILQYKYDLQGEYIYNVTFETKDDKLKLQTNDMPLDGLFTAQRAVVQSAIAYFCLLGVEAQFSQMTFTYSDNRTANFTLELSITSYENKYEPLILKSQKMKLPPPEVENKKAAGSNFNLLMSKRVSLVTDIFQLRNCLEQYASGKRAQQLLPFPTTDEQEKSGTDSLIETKEDDSHSNAEKITRKIMRGFVDEKIQQIESEAESQ
jgi:hypothetical protein